MTVRVLYICSDYGEQIIENRDRLVDHGPLDQSDEDSCNIEVDTTAQYRVCIHQDDPEEIPFVHNGHTVLKRLFQ